MLIDLTGGKRMKRRLILLCLSIILVNTIFSIDWKTELKKNFISEASISLGGYEYGNVYRREKDILCIQYNLETTIDKLGCKELESAEKIDPLSYRSKKDIFSDFHLNDNGYIYGKIANESLLTGTIKEVPVIFGDMFSFSIPGMTSRLKIGTKDYDEWFRKYAYEDGKYCRTEYFNLCNKIYCDIIDNVNSSSHLVETRYGIKFDYSGICLDLFLTRSRDWPQDGINPYCFPWVENAAGPGIGEWIEFELDSPQSITYILNGFVDGNRMHLYKANSRIKEAEFTGWTEKGKEIKQNVHFEDFVYFKTVQFSEPVTRFRITIKDAYPGDKWQDTCISAVMFPVLKK